MRTRTLTLSVAFTLLVASAASADGFFRRVPEVGEWARYELEIWGDISGKEDFDIQRAEELESSGELTLKCVGEETIDNVRHLWLEARLDVPDPGGTEHWMVYKALVPAEQVAGGDIIDHIVRGWVERDDVEGVNELVLDSNNLTEDPTIFGLMFAFPKCDRLAGRREDRTLTIGSEEVSLDHNETGTLVVRELEDVTISGETTWWPSEEHAFGIVSAEHRWRLDIHAAMGVRTAYTMQLDLAETGTDAASELPDHN